MPAWPLWVRPQLTQLVDAAPDGNDWLRLDGARPGRLSSWANLLVRHRPAGSPASALLQPWCGNIGRWQPRS